MTTGDRIRLLREQRAWRAEKLAAEADVSLSTITRLEANKVSAHWDHMIAIASALETSLDYLAGRISFAGPPVTVGNASTGAFALNAA